LAYPVQHEDDVGDTDRLAAGTFDDGYGVLEDLN
jgi:hypothetical protein